MTDNPVTLLERWQYEALQVFRAFIRLADENSIRWFAAYGTALGAVRHHGFIPWDDDIDVLVPRPDYDRLLALFSDADLGDYELVTPWNREGYYVPFSKFCKKNSTLVERKDFPCVLGIFIDIFPLDACADDPEQRKKDVDENLVLLDKLYTSCRSTPPSLYLICANLAHGNFREAIDLWHCRRNPKAYRQEVWNRFKAFGLHIPMTPRII